MAKKEPPVKPAPAQPVKTRKDETGDLGLPLTADDLYLFNEGNHFRAYQKMGAQVIFQDGKPIGTSFAVWAPCARYVSVIGDFNDWDRGKNPLKPLGNSGVWHTFIPGVGRGQIYKYHIASQLNGYTVDKADPYAFFAELPPRTGSVVWDLQYTWNDAEWMATRKKHNSLHAPINIYEVHVGSWRKVPEDGHRSLNYRELAPELAAYCKDMGYTHVEFMPVMEHPYYPSWGYQVTGFYAPTSRFGTPQDFMYLVDVLHQHGIGVILDWVPSHFPTDEHGLIYFDGSHLYEHADPRQGLHKEWGSAVFNYGRHEVRAFLISNALFWLDCYHVDGLRVDAVASMLYLDYNRKEGEWVPNRWGGKENVDAIEFLRKMNEEVYKNYPDVQTIAEESTSWSMVSRPTYIGGLGFGMKWDMGWMHDTLKYMSLDPIHRKYHHNQLTFRMLYAFSENFCLSLSHDEVVYGKRSLLNKMPGDRWQQFANLRLLFGYMMTQAGKKLLFMGGEFGQWNEWNHNVSLDWHLLQDYLHAGVQRWSRDLNHLYRTEPALHELEAEWGGFEWVDADDCDNSVLTYLRRGKSTEDWILVACNFTPIPRYDYRVGVPRGGWWKELLNSDAPIYGGSGVGNEGGRHAESWSWHNRPCSLGLTLPPLGCVILKNSPS